MRQFLSEKNADDSGALILDGKDYHYFKDVLRVQVGEKIAVRFPDGALEDMSITQIDENKHELTLQYNMDIDDFDFDDSSDITRGVKANELNNASQTEIWLFQFLPKMPKFEQIVRQATECGVSVIVPIAGEYTESSSVESINSGNKLERLLKIKKEARQQSGSPINTTIMLPVSLSDAIKVWQHRVVDDVSAAFVLSERPDVTGVIPKNLGNGKINVAAIACGNEGGISPAEIERLKKDGGFIPIHFATNVLRCETAAVYGVAALQTCLTKSIEKEKF